MPRRPLDILNFFAAAALGVLAVGGLLAGRLRDAPLLPLRCAGMAFAVLAMARLARRGEALPGWLRCVVEFYPIAFVTLVYDALGFLIPAINPVEKDHWLLAADRALFGVDPTVWLQRLVVQPLTDLLYLAYATFFLFPLVVGIPLWLRKPETCRRFVFLVTLTFYVSYLGYVFVPAEGPRASRDAKNWVRLQNSAVSRAVAHTLDGLERNRVDAFPSGHVLVTTVCLFVAARHQRRLFYALLPVGLLLGAATLYCRYHYVVDVLTSLVLAPLLPPLAGWLYDRLSRAPRGGEESDGGNREGAINARGGVGPQAKKGG